MANIQKINIVHKMKDDISKADYIYVCAREKMIIKDFDRLRLDAACIGMKVESVKNSLAKRAIAEENMDDLLVKENVFLYGSGDFISAASLISKYIGILKGKFDVKGALVDGSVFSAETVKKISKFKTVDGLRASQLFLMKSPLTKFVRVLKLISEKGEIEK
ncbi:MAG: 50S ribosomal protein L10 [Alphaproteobacteria bacterium]|nr:MAG: 50S ribosomal protein L10 [Alphaproteobacteria bacterium]